MKDFGKTPFYFIKYNSSTKRAGIYFYDLFKKPKFIRRISLYDPLLSFSCSYLFYKEDNLHFFRIPKEEEVLIQI